MEEIINLGRGQPRPDLLPKQEIAEAMRIRAREIEESNGDDSFREFLAYGDELGQLTFRESLAKWIQSEVPYSGPVSASDLFITGGASHALDLAVKALTQPGDLVFVDDPTYFLALGVFKGYGLKVVGVSLDDEGVSLDALEVAIDKHGAPKLFYTIPSFHNPTGRLFSTDRRRDLVAAAHKHNFFVLADEVYQVLWFNEKGKESMPPPMVTYDVGGQCADPAVRDGDGTGRVLSLSSFSKVLSPGLRLGWIQVAPQSHTTVLSTIESIGYIQSGGGVAPFTSAIVQTTMQSGIFQRHLEKLRTTYGELCEVMCAALHDEIPSEWIEFHEPCGGFFVWVDFRGSAKKVDAEKLLDRARSNGVIFHPGPRFSDDRSDHWRSSVRFSFAYWTPEQLRTGVRRFAQSLREEVELIMKAAANTAPVAIVDKAAGGL